MTITTRNASAAPLSLVAPSHQRAGGVRQASRAGYPVAAKPAPVYSRPDKSIVPAADAAAAIAALVKHNASPPVVRIHTTPASGFDSGDAGSGAAGGLALSMIAVGGGLAASQHRARRTRHSTA
jgi:hypothetical protein